MSFSFNCENATRLYFIKSSGKPSYQKRSKHTHNKSRQPFPNRNCELEFWVLLIEFRQLFAGHQRIPVRQQFLTWSPFHFEGFIPGTDQTPPEIKYLQSLSAITL